MNPEEFQNQAELRQQVQQLEMLVKQRMTKEALERFGNVKAAHPEKALQLLAVLGQAIQSNQIQEIDDDQLKGILLKLTPEKKDFKIKRR